MAKIPLSSGFTPIPEGYHVFKIVGVDYKEAFGKLEISMITASGKKHTERYALLKSDGTPNDGAANAFSYFAKTAIDDFTVEEIDPDDLVGRFIRCEVTHDIQPNRNNPNKTVTFVHLGDKESATGFDEETPAATPAKAEKPSLDLASILG